MRLLFSCLLALGMVLAADVNPAADNAVVAAANEFAQATVKADKAAMERLLADDVIYSHSSGRTESKLEYVRNIMAGKPKYEAMDMSDTVVRVYGKLALLRCKMKIKTVQDGKPNQLELSVLMNWLKDGKGWKMVARQSTRLNP